MLFFRNGAYVPEVTAPCASSPEEDRVAVARDAPLGHLEADELARRAARLLPGEHRAAVEVALRVVERDDPAQPGLDQGGRLVHVVAVQHHAGLEAERVARPEAGGQEAVRRSRLDDAAPERARRVRGDEDLEAVLAGVPGAGDDRRDSVHRPFGEAVERHLREVDRGERLEDRLGLRSLQGQQRELVAQVVEPAARRLLGEQPVPVLLDVRGVHDHEVAALGAAVDDDVVHRAARGHGQRGVLRLPVHELRDVVGRHALQEGEGALPLDLELAHVGDVEEAGGGPDGRVLGDEARVLDGHVPPAEGHHPGPAFPVDGVEWRSAELGHRTIRHAITGPRKGSMIRHRLDSEGVIV